MASRPVGGPTHEKSYRSFGSERFTGFPSDDGELPERGGQRTEFVQIVRIRTLVGFSKRASFLNGGGRNEQKTYRTFGSERFTGFPSDDGELPERGRNEQKTYRTFGSERFTGSPSDDGELPERGNEQETYRTFGSERSRSRTPHAVGARDAWGDLLP